MNFKNLFLLLSYTFLLTACSSAGPKYQNSSVSNAATIQGDVANFVRFFTSGESHVGILEIDGVETGVGNSSYKIAPGEHTLGITANGDRGQTKAYIKVNLKPNTKYKLTANTVGISMVVKIWDITNKTPVLLKTQKLSTTQPQTPIFIPIII